MSRTVVRPSCSAALLRQALGYTSVALASVREDRLDLPTPCPAWTLGELVGHLDDSLLAFTEAAELGTVLPPARVPSAPRRIVETVRSRAGDLLLAWPVDDHVDGLTDGAGPDGAGPNRTVRVDGVLIDRELLGSIGALEVTVHGWDVARATGLDHPIPEDLAGPLLEVAHDVVAAADRPGRFAPARSPVRPEDRSSAQALLLGFLGR